MVRRGLFRSAPVPPSEARPEVSARPARRAFLAGAAGLIGAFSAAAAYGQTLSNQFIGAGTTTPASQVIGGATVGQSGGIGTLWENFTLSGGDDFLETTPNLLSPANPLGRYFPSRPFAGVGAGGMPQRGGPANPQHLVDPYYTGWLDHNRGVPIGANTVRQSASVISLQGRAATAAESASLIAPATNVLLGAEFGSITFLNENPELGGATILDFKVSMSAWGALSGLNGGPWTQTTEPALAIKTVGDEQDVIEVIHNPPDATANAHHWTSGTAAPDVLQSYPTSAPNVRDTTMHIVSCKVNTLTITFHIDGNVTPWKTVASTNGNAAGLNIGMFFEMFVGAAGYVPADWIASGYTTSSGWTVAMDWWRMWRQTGTTHFTPSHADFGTLNVDYGSSGSLVLPSSRWNEGTPDVEEFQLAPFEINCPGVTYLLSQTQDTWTRLPNANGMTTSFAASTLSVANSGVGNAGRLHGVIMARNNAGSTCQAGRLTVNIGPNVPNLAFSVPANTPFSLDTYFYSDVGIITPKGFALGDSPPSGLVIDPGGDATSKTGGYLSHPTGLSAGTYNFTYTVTNSAGQAKTANVTLTVVQQAAVWMGVNATVADSVATSHTWTGLNIGPAYAGRYAIAVVTSRNGTATYSALANGSISGIPIASANGGTTSQVAIFAFPIPTGTTMDLQVTSSAGAVSRLAVEWYVAPLTSTTPTDIQSSGTIASSAVSTTLNVPVNGIAIAGLSGSQPDMSHTWTGASPDIPTFYSQQSRGIWQGDYGANVSCASKAIPGGNGALAIKDTFTNGPTGAPSTAVMLAVSLT